MDGRYKNRRKLTARRVEEAEADAAVFVTVLVTAEAIEDMAGRGLDSPNHRGSGARVTSEG
jgi:hypothetical protein